MASDSTAASRCYYAILDVDKSASTDEIRRAYKRAALQWHPDKNQGNEEAEERFKAIQTAYEILSDANERKWYDTHRDDIIGEADRDQQDDLNLWGYFHPSVFRGYGDTGKGFYAVYGALFDLIIEQERKAAFQSDARDFRAPPVFGKSDSSFEHVKTFYNYWINFVTLKEFHSEDVWNLATAPDRRHRRAMEEENKKQRKRARKEYIDKIRDLSRFVQKLDKRYAAMKEEQERLQAELEQKKREKKEKQARAKLELAQQYVKDDWVSEAEAILAEQWELDEMTTSVDSNEHRCIVCNKSFKSEKQWLNHEKSKKHKDKLKSLKEILESEENIHLEEDSAADDVAFGENPRDLGEDEASSASKGDGSTRPSQNTAYSDTAPESATAAAAAAAAANVVTEFSERMNFDDGEEKIQEKAEGDSSPINQPPTSPEVEELENESMPSNRSSSKPVVCRVKEIKEKRRRRRAKPKKELEKDSLDPLSCIVCEERFDSRNQLFRHISDTGHSVAKTR